MAGYQGADNLECVIVILPLMLVAAVASPAATAKAPPVQLVESAKRIPMSDEGRAIAAKMYNTPDSRTAQIASDLAALRNERALMIVTPPVDIDRLEALLRKEEALTAEARVRADDRLLVLLRALPEADRAIMLQNLLNAQKVPVARPGAMPTR